MRQSRLILGASGGYQLDVPAGSTIIFADGEYELDSHLDINKGDITLKAAEGATPILIATNKDQRIIGYDGSGSLSNITIDGLTFRAALGHQWSWGMINFETGSLSNITITNNVFENSNLVPIRIGDHIYTPDQCRTSQSAITRSGTSATKSEFTCLTQRIPSYLEIRLAI